MTALLLGLIKSSWVMTSIDCRGCISYPFSDSFSMCFPVLCSGTRRWWLTYPEDAETTRITNRLTPTAENANRPKSPSKVTFLVPLKRHTKRHYSVRYSKEGIFTDNQDTVIVYSSFLNMHTVEDLKDHHVSGASVFFPHKECTRVSWCEIS